MEASRAFADLRWWWRGVTGADAYERYVGHLEREHPGCPVPTEREFWREKYADQDRNPRSRCC
ncbi:MAG: YbdD/YjiX family protein [Dermatophilaceae bacterium]